MLRSRELLAATLAGSVLFFAFLGAFSYIDFRLERAPFSLSDGATGLVFLVWVMGAIGPTAGRVADRRGWSIVALGGLASRRPGSGCRSSTCSRWCWSGWRWSRSATSAGITAAQLGVGASTARTAGWPARSTSAPTTSPARSGPGRPGLAFERVGVAGVAVLCLAAYAVGASGLLLARRSARVAAA